MGIRTPHAETFVKVNAPVDVGIAPLVAALSEYDGLETVESCQGGGTAGRAFVIFRFGKWRDCGALLFDKLQNAMDAELRSAVHLTIESYDTDYCFGRISLPPEAVEALTTLVKSVRKYQCYGDK